MKIKIIAGLLLFSALLSLGWGWHATYQDLKAASKERDLAEAREEQIAGVLATERTQRLALEAARTKYLDELQVKSDEIATLRNDLASTSRSLRIRAACPAVPTTPTDAGGTQAGTAELDASARQAYLDLRAGIGKVESLLSLCRAELKSRSE